MNSPDSRPSFDQFFRQSQVKLVVLEVDLDRPVPRMSNGELRALFGDKMTCLFLETRRYLIK